MRIASSLATGAKVSLVGSIQETNEYYSQNEACLERVLTPLEGLPIKGVPSAVGFPHCAGSGEGLFLSSKPYPHKCAEAGARVHILVIRKKKNNSDKVESYQWDHTAPMDGPGYFLAFFRVCCFFSLLFMSIRHRVPQILIN